MGADLSRVRSNPLLDFAGVELKQGGVVLDADSAEAWARVHGEQWRIRSSGSLERGQTVRVTARDNLTLTVAPLYEADKGG